MDIRIKALRAGVWDIVILLGVVCVVYISLGDIRQLPRVWQPDPLRQLESATRQIPFVESDYYADTQDTRYWQARQVEFVLRWLLLVNIEYSGTDAAVHGAAYIDEGGRHILLHRGLHWNARLEVLAHEGAHFLAPPTIRSTAEGEVFADAVSYLVLRRLGVNDRLDVYAHYLAAHKGGLHILTDYRQEIEWAAAVLAGRL